MNRTDANGNSDYDGTPLIQLLNSNNSDNSIDSMRSATDKKNSLLLDASSKCDSNDDGKDEITSNVTSDGGESETSRISMSKVSKAGIVSTISQPIHLKKLSLRACGLRTVPKYFHKMDFIE